MRASLKYGAWISLAVLVLAPSSAFASLEAMIPASEETDTASEANVVLTFPVSVDPASARIEIIDSKRRTIPIEEPELGRSKTDLNVPLRAALQPGVYTIKWRAVTVDGNPAYGTLDFNVDR